MNARELTPLGRLLEAARTEVLHISAREAARRAATSEGRWRQVVTGVQSKGAGKRVPVNPKPATVVAMALAVQVDPGKALDAAGIDVAPEGLAVLVEEARASAARASSKDTRGEELAAEIERIRDLPISAATRRRMIDMAISLFEEEVAEAGAQQGGNQATGA